MREMGTQRVCKLPHELPQGKSAERIAKQHESWIKTVDVHALVSPLRFNCEYLL